MNFKYTMPFVGLLYAGCTPLPDRVAGQDRAEDIVWRGVYGELAPSPSVEWVYGLDCVGASGNTGFKLPGSDKCVAGAFWYGGYEIQVAWFTATPSISATAYAHELLHAHLYLRDGDGDGLHVGKEWKPGGDLVIAHQALVGDGL